MDRRPRWPNPNFIGVADALVRLDFATIQLYIQRRIGAGDTVGALDAVDFYDGAITRRTRGLRHANLNFAIIARTDAHPIAHHDLSRSIVQ